MRCVEIYLWMVDSKPFFVVTWHKARLPPPSRASNSHRASEIHLQHLHLREERSVQRIRQRYNASSGTEAIKHSDFISVKGARGTGMGSCGHGVPFYRHLIAFHPRSRGGARKMQEGTCHLYGHPLTFPAALCDLLSNPLWCLSIVHTFLSCEYRPVVGRPMALTARS